MKKIGIVSLGIALLLQSGDTHGDTKVKTVELEPIKTADLPEAKKTADLPEATKDDFYSLPMAKRIEDLEERKKKLATLTEEEKAKFDLQLRETLLLTVHNTVEDALKTVRGMVGSFLPKTSLQKAPIEKLADFVYLFDNTFRAIAADKEAYKANLKKLYRVTKCMTPKIKIKGKKKGKRRTMKEAAQTPCTELDCTTKKKCMAISLNCVINMLKPFSKVFSEGVEINGQHIDNGLVLMGKVIQPIFVVDMKPPKFIKDFRKIGFLLKLSIKFFAKTRDMFMASADEGGESLEPATVVQKSPVASMTPTKMAEPLEQAQNILNHIGFIANVADKFTQGLGKGFVGKIASSCVYSVVNLANMSTDIIMLIHTDMLDKTMKRFECLLKSKKKLQDAAAAYKGKPGDDKSCPSLGCIDIPTCHALTMLSLTNVIRPFIENFVGKAELDSSGNPTGKIEMGFLMNVGNAISEALGLITSSREDMKSGKLKTMTAPLAKLKDLIDKSKELEIMLAGILPRLIEAFERTALDINPKVADYMVIRAAQRTSTEEIMPEEPSEETVEEPTEAEEEETEKVEPAPGEKEPGPEETETGPSPTETIPPTKEFDEKTFDEKGIEKDFEELKEEMKGVENEESL